MFFIIYFNIWDLKHVSKPTQVTLLGDLWFLQVFLLETKMKTFLANGLHKKHFSQRATKKFFLPLANGLHTIFFSQRATQKIYENINATFGFRNFM